MKRFKLNWQSVAAGMILCAALGVFIGSKVAEPQAVIQDARTSQQVKSMATIYDRTVTLEEKIAALDDLEVLLEGGDLLFQGDGAVEEHLKVIEKKIDDTYHEVYYRLPK
jgi:cephalosporin hydroxylase